MVRRTRCVDCLAAESVSTRAAPKPGPRCLEHWRAEKRRRADKAHGRHVEKQFGITAEQYWMLYEAQGGKCAICQRSTGVAKRLAVEHNHDLCDDHPPDVGCPRCIRCLACGPCNKILGMLNVAALRRAIKVLTDSPARKILLEKEPHV